MAEKIIEHVYHLKGGEQTAVEFDNPLLDRREPIIVFCNDGTTRMKIGDGKRRFKDLPYVGGTIIYENNGGDNEGEGDSGNSGTVPGLQIIVDDNLSYISTNPVQNKVITQALDGKVSIEAGKGLSTNDFKDEFKLKLENIEYGANRTLVDNDQLNPNSSNAVSNAVVTNALEEMEGSIGTQISNTNQLVTDLETEVETLSNDVDTKLSAVDGRISAVNEAVTTSKDELNSRINNEVADINNSIDDVYTAMESNRVELSDEIELKAQQLNQDISNLGTNITGLDTKINTLDAEVETELTNMSNSIDDKVNTAISTQLPEYIQQLNLDGGRI